MQVPRVFGRLHASQIGLVINEGDPYSVAVGEHYLERRQLAPEQVLRVDLPVQAQLSPADLAQLKARIDARFGPQIQALALAWNRPYAVGCLSITGALAFGADEALCRNTCGRASAASSYFNSASSQPLKDHGWRPSMLLASGSVEAARRLIDRGVASDGQLGLRGSPPAQAWFLSTGDGARNVRAALFPPSATVPQLALQVESTTGDLPRPGRRVMLVQTGLAVLPAGLEAIDWVPGALADHLTSFGGLLDAVGGQTPATAWLDAGATASYGSVSEPCNHLQKFPHPQVLLLHYLQGQTAIEAYWKSVAWPQQGVFVGEPLAAPFARR
ncbi:TIGR03790 family protein [Leptothrix discophora]|uniref:TIGR03790 family protein n=1 Tax=Leptothrix discophora TaxID=89 RepID=A0ABT9G117_LEPDI|nr:TIGR03790 family protein [Leptothrix discophora]MDP4300120.1 TIGR03790 family protein [Leptothrix discophora]